MSWREDAEAQQSDLVELRRSIHREPEIGLRLPRTQRKVLDALAGLDGMTVSTGDALDSVTAVLRGTGARRSSRDGAPSVLLRADMDALPVREETGLPFAAPQEVMHACGHDLHTTMLVGAARILAAGRDRLAGDVVFMFQPGEEGYDGAQHMLDEGILSAAGELPVAAYAIHVTSAVFGTGVVATRPGTLMAAANVLHVRVQGQGGHASAPHLAGDPVPVAAEMVLALQSLVTRRFNIFDPVVVTVGSFHAGTQHNIIPDEAVFEATVRTFSESSQTEIRERAVQLCEQIAAAHGLAADVRWQTLYPPTVNDDAHSRYVCDTAAELFGPQAVTAMSAPMAGAEDFSRILQQVPGAMTFLGACPAGQDPASAPFNHAAAAVFDESVLGAGAALNAGLAAGRLRADRTDGTVG